MLLNIFSSFRPLYDIFFPSIISTFYILHLSFFFSFFAIFLIFSIPLDVYILTCVSNFVNLNKVFCRNIYGFLENGSQRVICTGTSHKLLWIFKLVTIELFRLYKHSLRGFSSSFLSSKSYDERTNNLSLNNIVFLKRGESIIVGKIFYIFVSYCSILFFNRYLVKTGVC